VTRRPTEAADQIGAVYEWLLRREQQAYWSPGRTIRWTPEAPSYTGSDERLAVLRAGEPVNVPVWELPGWVRAERGKIHWWHRAIVSADGAIEFVNDSGEWLAESGL
jgi:hypothetical protein